MSIIPNRIPDGAYLVECYVYKGELIICGEPAADDETHSCDEQGCSSMSHVLVRIRLARGWKPYPVNTDKGLVAALVLEEA